MSIARALDRASFLTAQKVLLLVLAGFILSFIVFGSSSKTIHPMDSLTADEIEKAVKLLRDGGYIEDDAQVPVVSLLEMPKKEVLDWRAGDPVRRMAFLNIRQERTVFEAEVDLTNKAVMRWESIPNVQTNQLEHEFRASKTLLQDEKWQLALAKRGYDDLEDVSCVPATPGYFGSEPERERRVGRVYCSDATFGEAHTFAHPIEGLYALIDLDTGEVLEIVDTGVVAVNKNRYDYEEAFVDLRSKLKPVIISAQQGVNFEIDDNKILWQNWSFHVRLERRDGLVVSLVSYQDGDDKRLIAYQIHASEMFVPYMDASPGWYYRTFMDVGEFGFGLLGSTLKPGADCPEGSKYQDAIIPDDTGSSTIKANVICIFERNTGRPVWRHAADGAKVLESRPDIELVVRTIPTIGNYDYVIDYVFTLSGNLRVDVGATGIVAVKGVLTQSRDEKSAAHDLSTGELVAPGLLAVYHDHYLSFRIDLDVDGPNNSFEVADIVTKDVVEPNPRRSVWIMEPRVVEVEGAIDRSPGGQVWRVINETQKIDIGHHPGIQIEPGHQDLSILAAEDYPQRRAGFSSKPLWVTQYQSKERYAAGDYPTQSRGGDGLPQWVSEPQSIRNQDLVVWYTVGFRHATRVEDWPVMPTKWHSFTLRPFNFFARNPALDLPSGFQ